MASAGAATYVATEQDSLVRKVNLKSGRLTTPAGVGVFGTSGNGKRGFSGDGGPALRAKFAEVDSVATGPAGNILFGDMLRIRSISP